MSAPLCISSSLISLPDCLFPFHVCVPAVCLFVSHPLLSVCSSVFSILYFLNLLFTVTLFFLLWSGLLSLFCLAELDLAWTLSSIFLPYDTLLYIIPYITSFLTLSFLILPFFCITLPYLSPVLPYLLHYLASSIALSYTKPLTLSDRVSFIAFLGFWHSWPVPNVCVVDCVQVILLEESWSELFLLCAIQWSMPMESSPLFAVNDHPTSGPTGKPGHSHSDMRVLQEVTSRFRSIQVDPAEFACHKAILLFKPGKPRIQNVKPSMPLSKDSLRSAIRPHTIVRCFVFACYCWKYIEAKHPLIHFL